MTYQDILAEVKRLSIEQRLELMEALALSLRDDKRQNTRSDSSVHRIRGLLKPAGPIPDDTELRNDYARFLIEKYT